MGAIDHEGLDGNAEPGTVYGVKGAWLNKLSRIVNRSRITAGQGIRMDSSETGTTVSADAVVTPEGVEVTTDHFFARLRTMQTISGKDITDIELATEEANAREDGRNWLELTGYRFHWEWDEVYFRPKFVDTGTPENGPPDELNDAASWAVVGGRTGRFADDTQAYNLPEFQHQPMRSTDTTGSTRPVFMIYGVNIKSLYYPEDFHPIPPGMYFEIRQGSAAGYGYHYYKDLHATSGVDAWEWYDPWRGSPVVQMFQHKWVFPAAHPDNPTGEDIISSFYYFNQMGVHDGGCAPVPA